MSSIYQHFRPEEKQFIDTVLDWKQYVENTYAPKLTDFLDPRQQFILQSVIGEGTDVRFNLFGGSEQSERKRALLHPEYYQPVNGDFLVGLYEIEYPRKFIKLEHPMVLGSLMSLGVKRDKFGDILVNEERIQFFSSEEIESFLMTGLREIGRASVHLRKLPVEEAIQESEQWKEMEISAASLRLDGIISAAFNLSRQKSQALIEQKLVKLNWKTVESPAAECLEGDLISARRLGRCKIIELLGTTKKNKVRLKIGLLK
ncbi:MAG TPA: RNA-binding protein [Bacillus bacterium]|uniref:RNA-binding protein S4 n=1 Tax=Siminovitchia fordii TaxID=254759 RepID=A0ABQ4JZP1_9BACI|nr:RNA-binding protein [Siminovitchia fordii]GIN19013.1 RNA-binding protein S4 [Siminovitchia fordii]HBZ10372.1 RNA-binding protein [Bacillus sp. (in: firmicutes)]